MKGTVLNLIMIYLIMHCHIMTILHIVLDPLVEEGGAYIELCIARWAESVTP